MVFSALRIPSSQSYDTIIPKHVLQVIKMSDLNRKTLNFISCEVTNTRLMGVVGVHSKWKDVDNHLLHVLFHLDYEDYGIDGYRLLVNPTSDEVNHEVQKMAGGLGGVMVSVGSEELQSLLYEAYQINLAHSEDPPYGIEPWLSWLQEGHLNEKLYEEICEPIVSNFQKIHYAVMRLMGKDRAGFEFLTKRRIPYSDIVEHPSMLLRNAIEKVEDPRYPEHYVVTSLTSVMGKYKIIHWSVGIDEKGNFVEMSYMDDLSITGQEAALLLRRDEFLCVYQVADLAYVTHYFDTQHPELMCNQHATGTLYTAFRSHNNHVKDPVFYLNGDIFAVYYMTQNKEMIISSFDENCYKKALEEFDGKQFEEKLYAKEQYQLNQSIIYEFVHSDVSKFKDFIKNL